MIKDYRKEMRTDLNATGKTIADLSRASGIPYKRLSGFFCSYWWLNQNEERQIRSIIGLWQKEAKQQEVPLYAR